MTKISTSELNRLFIDIDTPDDVLTRYLTVQAAPGNGLMPLVLPNSETVDVTDADLEAATIMSIGNRLERYRRRGRAERRLRDGDASPVIVTEGDSWFQFPVVLTDVIDHLERDFIPWSLGAAGDTLDNMVYGRPVFGGKEFVRGLLDQIERVTAFAFSGAGNDIVGEGLNKQSALLGLLRDDGHPGRPHTSVDWSALKYTIKFLRAGYTQLISEIRQLSEFANLPILVHGYDYFFPGPDRDRTPLWGKPWLSGPLDQRGILGAEDRREVMKLILDELYSMLYDLAETHPHVHVVDVRDTLCSSTDFADEIHPTSVGYEKVARVFKTKLDEVI